MTPSNGSGRVYMDNAATSFPKPPGVLDAMSCYARDLGASPGRGSYAEACEAGRLLTQCRERISTLINGEDPNHVIFTLNASDALNMAIHGVVRRDDHVITTWLDHNSVLRPFNSLVEHQGVTQTRVQCDPSSGLVDPDEIRQAIRPNTSLIAVVHGSNVTGTVQPVGEVGRIAREHDIPLLVDAAQTIGHMPIDVQELMIDLLAYPGHKGLLGPLGTGGLYIRPGIEKRMRTYREGGTGSVSELDVQPTHMPDRFEPGSHNTIGLLGLSEAVGWVMDQGVEKLWQHERELCRLMIECLGDRDALPGVTLFGPGGVKDRCGVFSVRVDGFDDPQTLSTRLEHDYGVLTRSGLHCAPLAHRTIGTYDLGGTTRLSTGPFLTSQDVIYACDALAHLSQDRTKVQVAVADTPGLASYSGGGGGD